MIKVKIKKKKNQKFFVIKNKKRQRLNMREAEAVKKRSIESLAELKTITKKGKFKLIYNISGYLTLREYMKMPITKQLFALMLSCFAEIFHAVKDVYFDDKRLLLDDRYVLVNPSSKRLCFIYVPIQEYENQVVYKDFFLKLGQNSTFDENEDTLYVRKFIHMLNNNISFSLFEFEEYINEIKTIEKQEKFCYCPKCGVQEPEGARFCSSCGCRMGERGISENLLYNPAVKPIDVAEIEITNAFDNKSTSVPTQSFSGSTTVLGQEQIEGTTVLSPEPSVSVASILRKKTNEKKTIDSNNFYIGKDKSSCGYVFYDNNAVSQRHAHIITRDNRYFLVDNNSTNKTFIDSIAIEPDSEYELLNNSEFRIADEDFIFIIEAGK